MKIRDGRITILCDDDKVAFVFEVPGDLPYHKEGRDKILVPILEKVCPMGWGS